MRFAFRADAAEQIGTGHLMRCLTLADALKIRGAQIRFLCRHLPEHLRDILASKGHELILLESAQDNDGLDDLTHAHWLGVSQAQDAVDSIQSLSDEIWDWLIIDHYALDFRWELMLRGSARKFLVIDDLADRQHDCDVLLDQNFYAEMESRYVGKIPSDCQLFLGPRYALLRDQFCQLHKQVTPRFGQVKRILVFFGGVDADNYTGRTIVALSELDISDIQVDVVIGAQHPSRDEIKALCVKYGYICHVQTDRMAELMVGADLAIGAGGSAIWERCCLGLPTLTICTAVNQEKQISDTAQEGFLYAPLIGTDLILMIKNHMTALLENNYLRCFLSNKGMRIVDGRGVLRIVDILDSNGLELRMATANDSMKLFEWRNHPSIRSVSRNTDPIVWEDHQKWFAKVLGSDNRILLIGQNSDGPIGVVRFDREGDTAEVSIYLIPDAGHSGQGYNLLLRGEQWISKNRPEIKNIRACVIDGNEPSRQLFLKADYQVESTHYLKRL